jgi:hypothetical protein
MQLIASNAVVLLVPLPGWGFRLTFIGFFAIDRDEFFEII